MHSQVTWIRCANTDHLIKVFVGGYGLVDRALSFVCARQ